MQRLWIKSVGEGDYLICLNRDSAKEVDVAFNIILEVPIGDRTQKWHSGIHCLTARLSRAKPIGAGQTILGVMAALGHHVIPAILSCPVRPKGGHSANTRVYEYTPPPPRRGARCVRRRHHTDADNSAAIPVRSSL